MPQIPITSMPDAELVRLINVASAELARRMNVSLPALPAPTQPATSTSSTAVPIVEGSAKRPPSDDCDYVLYVKEKLKNGAYILAAERQRVAEIAQEFPLWVRRQGLPTKHNAGDWSRAGRFASARRTKER